MRSPKHKTCLTSDGLLDRSLVDRIATWLEQRKFHTKPLKPHNSPQSDCLLQQILATSQFSNAPIITRLVQAGFTLRDAWPCNWTNEIEHWVGPRFYFGHTSTVQRHRFAAILCSQLGRDSRRMPAWPSMLESALRDVAQHADSLLLAEGTTLFDACREYAARSSIELTELKVPQQTAEFSDWLWDCFTGAMGTVQSSEHRGTICVSPIVQQQARQVAELEGPLADRLLLALADRVFCVHIRSKGRLEQLVHQRLSSSHFPVGSLFVQLFSSEFSTGQAKRPTSWLDEGAVGWLVPDQRVGAPVPTPCRPVLNAQKRAVQQVLFPAQASVHRGENYDEQDWPFLVHCTRAIGRFPDESASDYRLRMRISGEARSQHPLTTLHQICASGRLLGSKHLNRAGLPVVSFACQPLMRVLARRSFRSHLNRWDWEPYGLVIRKTALSQAGCRPVHYGTDPEFERLPDHDRAFFQPLGKKNQWSDEKEWRVVGDLELSRLPNDAITLFVRSRCEARYLARMYPWSVMWIEAS